MEEFLPLTRYEITFEEFYLNLGFDKLTTLKIQMIGLHGTAKPRKVELSKKTLLSNTDIGFIRFIVILEIHNPPGRAIRPCVECQVSDWLK